MAAVVSGIGSPTFSPLTDLHSRVLHKTRNMKTTLHGHFLTGGEGGSGLYLGHLRDGAYPGTDSLPRPVSPVAVEYLDMLCDADYVLAEGQKLMTRPFIRWLRDNSDPLFVHLVCDHDEMLRRVLARDGNVALDSRFIKRTSTTAAKILSDLDLSDKTIKVDTTNLPSAALDKAVARAVDHIVGGVL